MRRVGYVIALGVATGNLLAQTTADYAVRVSAVAQVSPPRLSFSWVQDLAATEYRVYRRTQGSTGWGTQIAVLAGGDASSFVDSTVQAGQAYEYRFSKTASTHTGYGYVLAGIEVPAVEQRGAALLVVDTAYATALAPELARLAADMTGDGWQVVRRDVSGAASVTAIKAVITQVRSSYPSLETVFLFGAIAIPYSGNMAPDGHAEHVGAWPADVFYGEMDGAWTDNTVNTTSATDAANRNVPGDGKYDQSSIPSDVELSVGRVDVARMDMFTAFIPTVVTFTDLMRRYLDKDHAFRHGQVAAQRRGLVDDNFGAMGGEAFASMAWRGFTAMFGRNAVHERDWFTTLNTESYLWAYGCGPGNGSGASGVGSSTDFRNTQVNTVFTALFGSWFGDWAPAANFLRAPLFSRPSALICFWSGRPHWHVHPMALGQTIGYCTRLSQNNASDYVAGSSARGVHVALMGDPTLRMHPVLPPADLAATAAGARLVGLSWGASSDTVAGYHLYRAASLSEPFTRLTSAPVTALSWTDTAAPPGNAVYMVRALKLETSASGTYYNLSQGVFDSVSVPVAVARAAACARRHRAVVVGEDGALRLNVVVPDSRAIAEVQNLAGRTVRRAMVTPVAGSGAARIDLGSLTPGLYVLRVIVDGAAVLEQAVVAR